MTILKIIEVYYPMQQNASQYNTINEDYLKDEYKQVNIMYGMKNTKQKIQ